MDSNKSHFYEHYILNYNLDRWLNYRLGTVVQIDTDSFCTS